MRYLWRAVDPEGEVLKSFGATTRDKAAAPRFMGKCSKRRASARVIPTEDLRCYKAVMKETGDADRREVGR